MIRELAHKWTDKTKFGVLEFQYKENWEMLFELGDFGYPMELPLTRKILSDPTNEITKRIIYLYSMESFIYTDLNKTCRDKDESKIKYYGAFAAALSYILDHANLKRKENKLSNDNWLFRGIKLERNELDTFIVGEKMNLCGYTSTSKEFSMAM